MGQISYAGGGRLIPICFDGNVSTGALKSDLSSIVQHQLLQVMTVYNVVPYSVGILFVRVNSAHALLVPSPTTLTGPVDTT